MTNSEAKTEEPKEVEKQEQMKMMERMDMRQLLKMIKEMDMRQQVLERMDT